MKRPRRRSTAPVVPFAGGTITAGGPELAVLRSTSDEAERVRPLPGLPPKPEVIVSSVGSLDP